MLPLEQFKATIKATPLVSIDLIVRDDKGLVLLGKRVNRPAQGSWFVPGGRVLKDEMFDSAFRRLIRSELGLSSDNVQPAFLGVYQHFYQDNLFDDSFTTHYIVLAYEVVIDRRIDKLPSEQHSKYKWFTEKELIASPHTHTYTKWYFQDNKQAHSKLILR